MLLSFPRPVVAVLWAGLLAAAGTALAQSAPPLRQALDAAWALSPQARALASRQAAFEARGRATASLLSGPPSVSLAHRSDRAGSNGGLRELEAELSAPVWNPGVRSATRGELDAERLAFDRKLALAKLGLAAEVRDLAAQSALARNERDVAARKHEEAGALAADVGRRVRAGELARVDLLQAQALQQQAASVQAQASSAMTRLQARWLALTGLPAVAELEEATATATAGEHPALAAAQAELRAAQARLALAEADRRDPVEVGVGLARERAAYGAASETSLRLALRVPLGSEGRNAPRLAAARAEVDAAEADADAAQRTVLAGQQAARSALEAAQRSEVLAAERERLSREVQALIAKAYQLGESDLPTRLRADSERFDAELAHARARVEARHALSTLNQALGSLP